MDNYIIKELAVKDAIAEGVRILNALRGRWPISVDTSECPMEALDRIVPVKYRTVTGPEIEHWNMCQMLQSAAIAVQDFEDGMEPDYSSPVACIDQHKDALYYLRHTLLELCDEC